MFLYVCKQTFGRLYGYITREWLELRIRNFQGIIFIWRPTYREIFRPASVYRANQLTGFYMMGTLVVKGLSIYEMNFSYHLTRIHSFAYQKEKRLIFWKLLHKYKMDAPLLALKQWNTFLDLIVYFFVMWFLSGRIIWRMLALADLVIPFSSRMRNKSMKIY